MTLCSIHFFNTSTGLHQFRNVDLVLESLRPVLVREAALTYIALHTVQKVGVVLGALQSLVARHFGIKLVDARAQHETSRMESARLPLIVLILAVLKRPLLDDGYKCFHNVLFFSD